MADQDYTDDAPEIEEYQEPSENQTENYEAFAEENAQPKNPIIEKILEYRKILAVLGLFIVIFAVYKLVGVIFSSNSEHLQEQAASQAVLTPTEISPLPSAETTHATVTAPSVAESTNKFPPQVESAIDETSPTVQAAKEIEIQNLRASMTSLQINLATVQKQLTDLQNTFQSVNAELMMQKRQSAEQQRLLLSLQKAAQPDSIRPTEEPEIFYIQAIIPGRVWLKSNKGRTITASLGDSVMGYGQITRIDPTSGFVMTSSGKPIQFSPSDT